VKKWFAKAAMTAGLLGMTAGPVLAASPSYWKGYGSTQENLPVPGHWSMDGGPVQLNAPSTTLTFHYGDVTGNDMICVFQNAGDIKLDNSVTPNFIVFTPSACFKVSGPIVPQPPNAQIVFEAVSVDGGQTYSANAFSIFLSAPTGDVEHFTGTASLSTNP
jgi:hypothetical protein